MPPVRSRQQPSFFSGGGRMPPIVGLLIAMTVVASIVGALGQRNGFAIAKLCALEPNRLLHGELWRLVTWVFFDLEPLNLLFGCAMLYWFGRDLAHRFGAGRFALIYLGGAAVVGATTFAVSRIYPPLGAYPYLGSWSLKLAMTILFASYYPTRQVLMYFVAPMGGRNLVLITLAGTVLFAIFEGIVPFVPNFIAELLALAFVYFPSPRELWLESKLRGMEKKRRTHLKAVPRESNDDDKPPNGRWLN